MPHPAFKPGHVAVVSGAALGIGKAMSRHFSELGMRVAMLDVDEDALAGASAEAGGHPFICDVANPEDWRAVANSISDRFRAPPSVLVNNAVTRIGRGFDADIDEWRTAIDINLMGVVNGVRCFRPAMEGSDQPGVIINVGSKQGITNPPGHPVYNLTKAAVKSYTESLQHDLRQNPASRLSAHLLVPGWTTTGRSEHREGAWLPHQVVEYMMASLDRESFYIICPDDETTEAVDRERILHAATDITEDRVALSRWHKPG